MRPLSDNPIKLIENDEFGFMPYVKILGESIVDADSLPFTIGIFGEWGNGKTSLMNLLKQWLKTYHHSIKTIWFNPWIYDKKEEIWSAFIQRILAQIRDNANVEIKDKANS